MRNKCLIVIFSLALAMLASVVTARINTLYLNHNPYYGDTASYTLMNVRAYLEAEHHGRWHAILEQIKTNGRNPLRIIPALAINPELLASENGHLVTGGVILFAFMVMLGFLALQRTESLAWALLACAAPLTARGFFDPLIGFGANYPDLCAGLLFACAYISLLQSQRGSSSPWLAMFGVFAACATLSRWTAGGYVFFVCAPVLGSYIVYQWWKQDRRFSVAISKILWVGIPLSLICGYYLLRFSKDNIAYYSFAAYGIGRGWHVSWNNVYGLGMQYFSQSGVLFLVLLVVVNLVFWFRKRPLLQFLESVWAPVLFFVLYVFILKLAGDPSTPYHVMILTTAFACAPFDSMPRKKLGSSIAIVLLIVAFGFIYHGYKTVVASRTPANAPDAAEYQFQRQITQSLIENSKDLDRAPKFDTFFFPYGRNIVIESVTRAKKELTWSPIFEKHDVFWNHLYPNQSPEQMAETVFEQVNSTLDFVAIIPHPEVVEARPLYISDMNEVQTTSIGIIQGIYPKLTTSLLWEKIGELQSPWGVIEIYKKARR